MIILYPLDRSSNMIVYAHKIWYACILGGEVDVWIRFKNFKN